jgi:hypothetical protein
MSPLGYRTTGGAQGSREEAFFLGEKIDSVTITIRMKPRCLLGEESILNGRESDVEKTLLVYPRCELE